MLEFLAVLATIAATAYDVEVTRRMLRADARAEMNPLVRWTARKLDPDSAALLWCAGPATFWLSLAVLCNWAPLLWFYAGARLSFFKVQLLSRAAREQWLAEFGPRGATPPVPPQSNADAAPRDTE